MPFIIVYNNNNKVLLQLDIQHFSVGFKKVFLGQSNDYGSHAMVLILSKNPFLNELAGGNVWGDYGT
jgi:hypothetical protein